jgi:cell division protein FtsB
VVFEASLDPNLLTEDVDSLGPAAVAEQLQALRKKQAQLRKAAEELARRRAALEEKAETLDNE